MMRRSVPAAVASPDAMRRRWLGATLAAVAAVSAAPGAFAAPAPAAATARRIVTMNWELTETLLALGVAPVGTSLPDWYRTTIVEPPLPAGVADIGLLYQPNFDVLRMLAPDLFVITAEHAPARPSLERLAPTITLGGYMSSDTPYAALCDDTARLAARLQRPARASALIADASRTTEAVRARIAARPELSASPVIVADLVDDRHLRVYGRGSLFDAMLAKLGVRNAVNPSSGGRVWATQAGAALVPLQRLVDVQQASLLLVAPVAAPVVAQLRYNAIWQALLAVRARRVARLPVIAPYGGLVSMQRFAHAIDNALGLIAQGGGGVA
ncbi:ABC transporter substrate-binding protein [Caballeronia sp. LZ001]|uniref:ABC transporter substrate-binding protein n=1 Tax=Caballeronia sp. LZ001 TaxID=3038553 RepID=UPI00285756A8|nr:ABC transporter substrate-binding protein [Caballeronia sp. LZ001]MDR5798684.1 ABC transporter substrate-binding protein [Caballeronia sp. LZ001]